MSRADQPLEPVNPRKAQVGHGHSEHGSQTTAAQQEQRIKDGTKPSGGRGRPPSKASKFTSPEAEAEALGRGKRQLEHEIERDNIPEFVNGEPNRHPVTVETDRPKGFGERWVRKKNEAGQNIRDANGNYVPEKDSTVLKKAKIIYEYVPSKGKWEPVTYFPSE